MIKVFQRNQKKLLAIFGVLLMIVFILPSGMKNARGISDHAVDKINGNKIYASEMRLAREEWTWLSRQPAYDPQTGQRVPIPVAQLSKPVADDITKHPEMFLLLQKEAEQDGVQVSNDLVNSILV